MRITEGFEYLVAQRIKDWQMRQQMLAAKPAALPSEATVVTISREPGSGGTEVAQAVAEQLGWDLWDRQLVEEIARSAQVRTQVVESLDEHARSEVEAVLHELLGDHLDEMAYRRHLAQVILSVARHGNAVIVGRGANYLLPSALNVRIVAPMEQRVARVAKEAGLSPAEAARRCQALDRERAEFVRALFHREISDPLSYDLVVNTAQLGVEGATAVVVAAARERFRLP